MFTEPSEKCELNTYTNNKWKPFNSYGILFYLYTDSKKTAHLH
jgi:hypothetical protein